MTKLERSALLWMCVFLAFELPPVFWRTCPWFTLSSTVTSGIKWWHPLAVLVAAFMVTLYFHFDRGWSWALIVGEGALIALSVLGHLFVPAV